MSGARIQRNFSPFIPAVLTICMTLLAAFLAGPPAHAAPAAPKTLAAARLPPHDRDRIRSLVRTVMEKHRIPGAAVAIALDDRIVYAEGFGLSDIENGIRFSPQTAVRSASIGKPMTATAVMKLVELGKIDLSANVQTYCPQFPPKKTGTITTHHLLAHQSGIRHYGGDNQYAELYNTVHYNNVNDALKIFANDPLLHPPGERYTYSTFGYDVLGCVIQGATGKRFMDVMRELVFEPAGMKDTRDDHPRVIIPNRARGYVLEDGKLLNAIAVDMSSKLPAGGYITTVIDIVKFGMAAQSGLLVSPKTFALMTTRKKLNDGTEVNYGYGWGLSAPDDLWYGYEEVFHGGSTPGVSGMLYMLPKRHFVVCVMTNQEVFGDRYALVAEISKIVLKLGGT